MSILQQSWLQQMVGQYQYIQAWSQNSCLVSKMTWICWCIDLQSQFVNPIPPSYYAFMRGPDMNISHIMYPIFGPSFILVPAFLDKLYRVYPHVFCAQGAASLIFGSSSNEDGRCQQKTAETKHAEVVLVVKEGSNRINKDKQLPTCVYGYIYTSTISWPNKDKLTT